MLASSKFKLCLKCKILPSPLCQEKDIKEEWTYIFDTPNIPYDIIVGGTLLQNIGLILSFNNREIIRYKSITKMSSLTFCFAQKYQVHYMLHNNPEDTTTPNDNLNFNLEVKV